MSDYLYRALLVTPLTSLIHRAFENRKALIDELHQEQTDCYRLFHGISDGEPGLTIDRYGKQVLVQSFHQGLDPDQIVNIRKQVNENLGFDAVFVYNDRSSKNSRCNNLLGAEDAALASTPMTCTELGIHYRILGRHQGSDPLLFLDFRTARRWIKANAKDQSVLNTFSYTCGIGIAAAVGSAKKVTNIDFADSALNTGKENQKLNNLNDDNIKFIKSDFFPVIHQFAGLPVKTRKKPPSYLRIPKELFDIVVLDPPRWAKSPFGTVDLIRDYQSLLKPCLHATKENGRILCTNNVAKVDVDDWLKILTRCAEKAGRPIKQVERLMPEMDFPSHDNKPPLKIAILQL